jgi:two-component system OmpR family sensor kinase
LGVTLTIFYRAPTHADRPAQGFVQSMMLSLDQSVEESGPQSARDRVALFPERVRSQIEIEPVAVGGGLQESELLKLPIAPNGRMYRVEYLPHSQSSIDLPTPTVWGVLLAGLLFSIAWAYHLSKPIKILSSGFRRLSEGDLDARLDPAITRHSYEFAGLAEDFARMTGRLKQLMAARERLLHDVSHELRSPLTRLQLAIGLARQDPTRTAASLDRIEREAAKLNLLVDELLTLAWAEGSEEAPEDYFDPVETIIEIAEAARLEATEKGVSIDIGPPPGIEGERPLMVGSVALLQRAVDNVLRNAIRHSPQGAVVQLNVELEARQPAYRIVIRDHGPGVSAEMLGKMLEPFVHADPEGTGLGLSIADRATRALKGRLVLANCEDGGLSACFQYPAVALDDLSRTAETRNVKVL